MSKQVFTWWNIQTLGTFLKTLFYGKFVGKDDYGNKYYRSKKGERWVIYSNIIESTKITNEWYLWMHHTIKDVPNKNTDKYLWQKDHRENLSGTKEAYTPKRIKKNNINKKYDTWKK